MWALLLAIFLSAPASAGAPGHPGPECTADYELDVRLEPDSSLVSGRVTILFTNGVSTLVDTLWLHLYPNAYRDETTAFGRDMDARASYSFRASPPDEKGFILLRDWTADGQPVEMTVDETLAFTLLPQPLLEGDSVELAGEFTVHVPEVWSRMGRVGESYAMTQWYPKVCVLDERGWHLSRYRAEGEFYGDFGQYTVRIELPVDYVVAATGRCDSVLLSPDSATRIETWAAGPVHDFAWMAGPDATVRDHLFVYPDSMGGCSISVHLVLLDDSPDYWSEVPAIVDSTLLYYGQWYAPYPYGDLWVADCSMIGFAGMEYPQLVQVGRGVPFLRVLEMVLMHEIGHQWFYGMLANDEVDEAWLDEGMNTFSELRYFERKYGPEGNLTSTPSWLAELSDTEQTVMVYSGSAVEGESRPVLSTATDAGDGSYSTGATYYSKPALFLRLLQQQAGPELFDLAMRLYFERFTFHHPHSDDFQAILEEVSGRSWQEEFDFWLRGRSSIDVLVSDLRALPGDSTMVVVRCDDPLPHELSADLLLTGSRGDSLLMRATLSPEQPRDTLVVEGAWARATFDPFYRVPDRVPLNNSRPFEHEIRPLLLPIPRPRVLSTYIIALPLWSGSSLRLGAMATSCAMPVSMGGSGSWSGFASAPLEDASERGYWSLQSVVAVSRSSRHLLRTRALATSCNGMQALRFGLDVDRTGELRRSPRLRGSLSLGYLRVRPWTSYGEEDVEPGDGFELGLGIELSDPGYSIWWNGGARFTASPGWSGRAAYSRTEAEIGLATRVGQRYLLHTRLYAGGVCGEAPVQALLRPGGGLIAEAVEDMMLPVRGCLSTSGNYYIRSGPALPGYGESGERFRIGAALEQRLFVPAELPLGGDAFLFGGIGLLGDDLHTALSTEGLLADAGAGLRLLFLEGLFPFWVSDPASGEDQLAFRWRVRFRPEGLQLF
ncbi:M1 family metallopeptidase [Candidatus Fermentibacterales bacterium]|nr:M1 family metallopeptidase [Candidatus Fermentibacterales bacterium]